MSCFDAAGFVTIREWVGAEPSDVDLEDLADQMGTTDPLIVARSVLRQRLAELLKSPTQWSLSGDYNENWSLNVAALRDGIHRLTAVITPDKAIPGAPVVTGKPLTRSDRYRLFSA